MEKAGSPVISWEIDKKGGNNSVIWFLGNVVNVSNNIKPRHLEWQGSLKIGEKNIQIISNSYYSITSNELARHLHAWKISLSHKQSLDNSIIFFLFYDKSVG